MHASREREESDAGMHSWIPGYVLTKYRDYTMLFRGNDDGNGCVLDAKYAADAQYRPTSDNPDNSRYPLVFRYVLQRWYLLSRRRCLENVALSKYLKKSRRLEYLSLFANYILNIHIPPSLC